MGPMSNAPIDTIKTRIQRGAAADGSTGLKRIINVVKDLVAKEGVSALYKGITPRVLRSVSLPESWSGESVVANDFVESHQVRL